MFVVGVRVESDYPKKGTCYNGVAVAKVPHESELSAYVLINDSWKRHAFSRCRRTSVLWACMLKLGGEKFWVVVLFRFPVLARTMLNKANKLDRRETRVLVLPS